MRVRWSDGRTTASYHRPLNALNDDVHVLKQAGDGRIAMQCVIGMPVDCLLMFFICSHAASWEKIEKCPVCINNQFGRS